MLLHIVPATHSDIAKRGEPSRAECSQQCRDYHCAARHDCDAVRHDVGSCVLQAHLYRIYKPQLPEEGETQLLV